MNETETILIIIAIVIGILILVGGLGWGISVYARDQRRPRSGRTEEYHPPSPLLPPIEGQDVPESDTHSRIRWGDMVESDAVEPEVERVRFGNIEHAEEYEYTEVTPYYDGPILKCPVCHRRIDENEDKVKVCPKCQESCHQNCFELMDNKCPICGIEES